MKHFLKLVNSETNLTKLENKYKIKNLTRHECILKLLVMFAVGHTDLSSLQVVSM